MESSKFLKICTRIDKEIKFYKEKGYFWAQEFLRSFQSFSVKDPVEIAVKTHSNHVFQSNTSKYDF